MDTLIEGIPISIIGFIISGAITFVVYYFIWKRKKTIAFGDGLFCAGGIPLAVGVGFVSFFYGFSHLMGGNSENSGLPIALALLSFYVIYWVAVLLLGIVRNSKEISLYFLIFWSMSMIGGITQLLSIFGIAPNSNDPSVIFFFSFAFVVQFYYPLEDLVSMAYRYNPGVYDERTLHISIFWVIPTMMAIAGLIVYLRVRRQSSVMPLN